MSKVTEYIRIGNSLAPFRKITVNIGKLIWSTQSVQPDDHVVLKLFDQDVVLRFDNGRKGNPKEAVYQVSTEMDFDRFYSRSAKILIVHGGSVAGTSSFDPELMQGKMILPIYAYNCCKKIGDFELRVSVFKPNTDQSIMREIGTFLDRMERKQPCLLNNLHWELHKQQYL